MDVPLSEIANSTRQDAMSPFGDSTSEPTQHSQRQDLNPSDTREGERSRLRWACMFKNLATVVSLSLCTGLASCAPPAVPTSASVQWDFESGLSWKWQRTLQRGCVSWLATERWASVQLFVSPARCSEGPGISYLTGEDEIIFENYWPRGEMLGGNPCPFEISENQIAELRRLTEQASAQATTDGQKRVLDRIDHRLSVTNGAALMTYHGGWCSDLTMSDWETARRSHTGSAREDVWQNGR
jgi:hypothetical protein